METDNAQEQIHRKTSLTARLMLRYNIGCRDEDVLHIKKVDEDYFEEWTTGSLSQ